jgi:phosphotriesterase-related protein
MKLHTIRILLSINFVLLLLTIETVHGQDRINTVRGTIDTSELGFTLSHEHIMSNFGKDISETSTYDSTKLFNQVIPYLKNLKSVGVNSIFDCTTAYFGRRVDCKNSEATGFKSQIRDFMERQMIETFQNLLTG